MPKNQVIPPQTISFYWDPVSGTYTAKLANGASFTVERNHVSGKLANNLDLYRSGVQQMLDGPRPFKVDPSWDYGEARDRYIAEYGVTRVGRAKANPKPPRISLKDLFDD